MIKLTHQHYAVTCKYLESSIKTLYYQQIQIERKNKQRFLHPYGYSRFIIKLHFSFLHEYNKLIFNPRE